MPFDHDVLANVEATLDALSSPTPEQAYDALLQYDAPMVASAAARRALAGGGGGGFVPARNVGQCALDFTGLDVPINTATTVSWAYAAGDNGLVTVASATHPKPVTGGVYSAAITLNGLAAGTLATFTFDDDFYSGSVLGEADSNGDCSLTTPAWFCGALSAWVVSLLNATTDSPAVQGTLYVQRLT